MGQRDEAGLLGALAASSGVLDLQRDLAAALALAVILAVAAVVAAPMLAPALPFALVQPLADMLGCLVTRGALGFLGGSPRSADDASDSGREQSGKSSAPQQRLLFRGRAGVYEVAVDSP